MNSSDYTLTLKVNYWGILDEFDPIWLKSHPFVSRESVVRGVNSFPRRRHLDPSFRTTYKSLKRGSSSRSPRPLVFQRVRPGILPFLCNLRRRESLLWRLHLDEFTLENFCLYVEDYQFVWTQLRSEVKNRHTGIRFTDFERSSHSTSIVIMDWVTLLIYYIYVENLLSYHEQTFHHR